MHAEVVEQVVGRADEIALGLMNEYAPAGLALAFEAGERPVYLSGFGLARVGSSVPVQPETVFRIGSISKTMTAIGIMQLWEQGKLQLDDPVNRYLKHYQLSHRDPSAPQATIRHLLTHT